MSRSEMFNARSWLFAPGDSEKKMAKAADGAADIVLLDLEDAVSEARKPYARKLVREFLVARRSRRERLWIRINPLDGQHSLSDLAAVMQAGPGGVMLPKARGRRDVEILDNYLSAFEAAFGHEAGSTKVVVLATETAQGMLSSGDYVGAPRLTALSWGAEDLADDLGATENTNEDGSYTFTYELARSLCLLGAAAAGVSAIETIHGDFRDLEGLKKRAEGVRRAGFRGMLAIHPAQVEVINQAFAPSEAEIQEAREIVRLFESEPGSGTIGFNGRMLDRPHLARAYRVLENAGAIRAPER